MNTTTMHTRHFQFRADDTDTSDGRTIRGIGVPYGTETEITSGYFETFAPGSVTDDGAHLRYGHTEPLGVILAATDTDAGRLIEARISDTSRGRDIATLIRDGVLTSMSIGFFVEEYTSEEADDGTHVTITSARAVEYSVVEYPAYDAATISEIRSSTPDKEPTMTAPEVRALSETVEDLAREVKLMRSTNAATQSTPFEFRSLGHYAKALASGDEAAVRAFGGAVIGDTIARPAWLGVLDQRMSAKQPITNLFTHGYDLPDTGMTIEYAQRVGDTGVKVGKQAKEGDKLVTGKPAKYTTKSASIETYGGLGEMSLQAIERASVSLLDDLLYDQAMEYAKQIEAATRAMFEQTVTTAESQPVHTFAKLSTASVNDWTDFALTLIDEFDDTAYVMDGLAVSTDVFRALAHLDRAPKALQFTGAPTDHQGTITLRTGNGEFADLPVIRVPKWTGLHAVGFAREAIRVMEAPGAPLRLQDSSIVDLSNQFAVYGYAAHFAPHPDLIKALAITAA